MTTHRKHSDESIKLIDHLPETSEQSDDKSEWEKLKALLAQDSPSCRKIFPNE